jgi:hypothetical protein
VILTRGGGGGGEININLRLESVRQVFVFSYLIYFEFC